MHTRRIFCHEGVWECTSWDSLQLANGILYRNLYLTKHPWSILYVIVEWNCTNSSIDLSLMYRLMLDACTHQLRPILHRDRTGSRPPLRCRCHQTSPCVMRPKGGHGLRLREEEERERIKGIHGRCDWDLSYGIYTKEGIESWFCLDAQMALGDGYTRPPSTLVSGINLQRNWYASCPKWHKE